MCWPDAIRFRYCPLTATRLDGIFHDSRLWYFVAFNPIRVPESLQQDIQNIVDLLKRLYAHHLFHARQHACNAGARNQTPLNQLTRLEFTLFK